MQRSTQPTAAVIYLWAPDEAGARTHDQDEQRCRAYAERHGWRIARLIREIGGEARSPFRDGLTRAYQTLSAKQAEAILCADAAMLGDIPTSRRTTRSRRSSKAPPARASSTSSGNRLRNHPNDQQRRGKP